jgi:acetyl esterase/lipase
MQMESVITCADAAPAKPIFIERSISLISGWPRATILVSAVLLIASAVVVRAGEFKLLQDVPYLGADRSEKMDIYLPVGAAERVPVVLYIHGGGWTQGDKAGGIEKLNCVSLAKLGYAVASINYKLNTKGTADAYPQNIQDCKSALQFLRREARTYGFDSDRIAVAGASAGGHLAMLLAYTPDVVELQRGTLHPEVPVHVSCVINLFGIADVREWGHRSFVSAAMSSEERGRILDLVSPIAHVKAETVPTLIIHGTKDPTVAFSQAKALAATPAKLNVSHRLVAVENGEHAFPFTPHQRNTRTDLMPAVAEFLGEHLKQKSNRSF